MLSAQARREETLPYKLQPRVIHIHKPMSLSLELSVFWRRISGGGSPSEQSGEYFQMKAGGAILDGNFSDFEKIAMTIKDKRWHMIVKAPDAKEVEGEFAEERFTFMGRLANGLWLVLDSTNPGFTLERQKEGKGK